MNKGHHNLANLFYLRGRGHSFLPESPNTTYNGKHLQKIETLKLMKNVALFQAGQISKFYKEWEKLSSDPEILEMVQGTKIIFNGMKLWRELNDLIHLRPSKLSSRL